jgi:hypothetical protein
VSGRLVSPYRGLSAQKRASPSRSRRPRGCPTSRSRTRTSERASHTIAAPPSPGEGDDRTFSMSSSAACSRPRSRRRCSWRRWFPPRRSGPAVHVRAVRRPRSARRSRRHRGVLDEGLIEQVALVRSLTGRLEDAGGSRRKAAYQVSAGVDALAVNLAGTITSIGAAQVHLDLIAPTEHWQVRVDPSPPASATRIARHDVAGGQIQPALYESGRRAVWRHLAAAIADGEAPVLARRPCRRQAARPRRDPSTVRTRGRP